LANSPPADDREWLPHGAASADGKLWWFDLSWGIVSYGISLGEPRLLFRHLPSSHSLAEATPDIHTKRCITANWNKLRYVEIIAEDGDNGEAARVFMSTLEPTGWEVLYEERFEEIWNDNSYKKTWLPKEAGLVIVCRSNPDLVYFALEQHIFSVNIRVHQVLEFAEEPHELVNHAMANVGLGPLCPRLGPPIKCC